MFPSRMFITLSLITFPTLIPAFLLSGSVASRIDLAIAPFISEFDRYFAYSSTASFDKY